MYNEPQDIPPEVTPDGLIDEDPPPEKQVEIPFQPIMGDVQQAGMGAQAIPVLPTKAPPPLPYPFDEGVLICELKRRRDELTRRIAAIESMLGFVESEGDLAVRVAKLERFLGI